MPRYEASNTGKVRLKWGKMEPTVFRDPGGTLTINTSQDGIHASRRVARLVGEAWCKNYRPYLRAFYKDGNRENCHPSNLKWVSPSKVTGIPFSRNPKPINQKEPIQCQQA